MIGRLRGRLLESDADGTLVVDVGGVGYELIAPLDTVGRLGAHEGDEVCLFVHTHAREDALLLYGFSSQQERVAFRTLTSISKVGPKLALSILGAMSVTELAQVVAAGHTAQLTKVPGVGKKTAERISLELKGKIHPTSSGPAPNTMPGAAPLGQGQMLCDALVRMGFKPAEAERAIAGLSDLDRPLGELMREALALLGP